MYENTTFSLKIQTNYVNLYIFYETSGKLLRQLSIYHLRFTIN